MILLRETRIVLKKHEILLGKKNYRKQRDFIGLFFFIFPLLFTGQLEILALKHTYTSKIFKNQQIRQE